MRSRPARRPTPASESTSTSAIENRLHQVGRYSRVVEAGLGVIVSAVALAVVVLLPATLESASSAVAAISLPLSFVGVPQSLFGIGMYLHLMHLNRIRQLRTSLGEADLEEADLNEADARRVALAPSGHSWFWCRVAVTSLAGCRRRARR